MKEIKKKVEPFGTILGHIDNVPVYSNHLPPKQTTKKRARDTRKLALGTRNLGTRNLGTQKRKRGKTLGIKYQCVELLRRWLIKKHLVTFSDVPNAHAMFNLSHVTTVSKKTKKNQWLTIYNGTQSKPPLNAVLIWGKRGTKNNGHVAIVKKIQGDRIGIIEQNNENIKWKKKDGCSRFLKLVYNEKNHTYTVQDPPRKILGWKILPQVNAAQKKHDQSF
jgi:hypothetical protein